MPKQWPAFLAAHCRHGAFGGHPSTAGPLIVPPTSIERLGEVTLRNAVKANRANLARLRALKRCILSDVEHAGDVGALLCDAPCALDAHFAHMLAPGVAGGIVVVHSAATQRGGSAMLPWVGACLAFAMAHHAHIRPPSHVRIRRCVSPASTTLGPATPLRSSPPSASAPTASPTTATRSPAFPPRN